MDSPVEGGQLDRIIRDAVSSASAEDLPRLRGLFAEMEARVMARLAAPHHSTTDENISAVEAARRLGVSKDWLYKANVPFKVRIGRRTVFSSAGLERWNRQRMAR